MDAAPPATFQSVPFDSPAYHACLALRHAVLRAPLGKALSQEDTANEDAQLHFALFASARPLACVSFRPLAAPSDAVQLRQMAVAPDSQGSGLGRCLLAHAEPVLRRERVRLVVLHARQSAAGFYRKLGYRSRGDPFQLMGIEHLKMSKAL